MTVFVRVALNAAVSEGQDKRDLSTFEQVTLTGEGDTYETAKAAVQIPDGAVVIAYSTWPI